MRNPQRPAFLRCRQRHAGQRVGSRRHDDELQQVAETGLDGPFVGPLDLQVIGHRAVMRNAVARRQHRAGGVAVRGARRVELFERLQAGADRRHLLLAGPPVGGPALDRAARRRERGLVAGPARSRIGEPLARLTQRVPQPPPGPARRDPPGPPRRRPPRRASTATRPIPHVPGGGVVDDVLEGGGGATRGEHLAARRLDVAFAALDSPLRIGQRALRIARLRRQRVALGQTRSARGALRGKLTGDRNAPLLEVPDRLDARGPRGYEAPRPAVRRTRSVCCRRSISSSRRCADSRTAAAACSHSASSRPSRSRVFSTSARGRGGGALLRRRLGQPGAWPPRSHAPARRSGARTRPSASAATRRAAGGTGAPSRPGA